MELIIIVLVLFLLFGGGRYYGYSRPIMAGVEWES